MIVSHEHRFIFLKTRKTAGTSIEIALSRFCGDADLLTPILPAQDEEMRHDLSGRSAQNTAYPFRQYTAKDWARLAVKHRRRNAYNHMPATEARGLVGSKVWKSYYKFAVSRNPWDVVLSMFEWSGRSSSMTLSEFLGTEDLQLVARNYSIYSIDGAVAVDQVCCYDTLADDLETARLAVGIPAALALPHAKASARAHPRGGDERTHLFSAADVELVTRRFADEIALMRYRF